MIDVSASADSFLADGDSTVAADFQYHDFWYLVQDVRHAIAPRTQFPASVPLTFATATVQSSIPAAFATATVNPGMTSPGTQARVPPFANFATSGATTATLSARKATVALRVNANSIILIKVGRNDHVVAIAPADSATNLGDYIDTMIAAGVTRGLVAGWLMEFEDWQGGNAQDANIATLNAALKAKVDSYGAGWEWVDVRADVYDALEPTLNPGSTAIGPLAAYLDPIGVHELGYPGSQAVAAAFRAHINVVA